MDKSVDNKINQLHPSKILDEMGISWNDDIEKKTSSLYKLINLSAVTKSLLSKALFVIKVVSFCTST